MNSDQSNLTWADRRQAQCQKCGGTGWASWFVLCVCVGKVDYPSSWGKLR